MEDLSKDTVVAVHPHADLYGSDRMFLESVAAMTPDITVVLSRNGPLVDALQRRGIDVRVQQFPVLRKVELATPRQVLAFVRSFLLSVVRLTSWLRSRRPAVVYVSTVAAPQWLIAARLSGSRVVCHVHEGEPQMSRAASTVLLLPLVAAHVVITVSEDSRDWIRSSLGARLSRRCQVVHNGVPEPSMPEATAPVRAPGSRSLVLVGRLAARKGQDTAIRATALVRRAGHHVTLTLVGDGYPGYEDHVRHLHELVAGEGIADFTRFTGFQDPVTHVAGADVVLVPSRVEPFGLVAVEALLLGRAVVASRVGGLPEIVEHRRTGLLIEPDDPRALADAVIELLSDPEAARALGEAGRVDARARFSMAAYRAKLSAAVLPGS